jgi:hypothetical protein
VYPQGNYHDPAGGIRLPPTYFRTIKGKCSSTDMKVAKLELTKNQSVNTIKNKICSKKTLIDNAKMIAGCTSTGLSIACAYTTNVFSPLVCTGTWYYATTTGLVDCIDGLGSNIAKALKEEPFYYAMAANVGLKKASVGELVSAIIDSWCENW